MGKRYAIHRALTSADPDLYERMKYLPVEDGMKAWLEERPEDQEMLDTAWQDTWEELKADFAAQNKFVALVCGAIFMVFMALILIGLLATPAAAAECHYQNWKGDKAFSELAAIQIQYADGEEDYCPSTAVGTGMPYRFAECESGYEGIYSYQSDALIFQNDIWLARCE